MRRAGGGDRRPRGRPPGKRGADADSERGAAAKRGRSSRSQDEGECSGTSR